VDETYLKVNGVWCHVYQAIDQHRQLIDVAVSKRRNGHAARLFFTRAVATLKMTPTEVVTDKAPVYPRVLDELVPAAWHHIEQYENNRIEADHGRLKHRRRTMRGLRTDRTATVIIAGLAFMQNLRRGQYKSEAISTRPGEWPPQSPSSLRRSDRRNTTPFRNR
jgi:transposase-like protein